MTCALIQCITVVLNLPVRTSLSYLCFSTSSTTSFFCRSTTPISSIWSVSAYIWGDLICFLPFLASSLSLARLSQRTLSQSVSLPNEIRIQCINIYSSVCNSALEYQVYEFCNSSQYVSIFIKSAHTYKQFHFDKNINY